ncbi:hypothetical protein MMC11_006273 [Xylographa trunciseda]|nr:hypothetical protein [Xylographa trunciseda]
MASHIAILGAGPAGLTLAGLLHRANVKYTLFEKDDSASWTFDRNGSGTLDLHKGAGLLALEKLGLMDRFNTLARHKVPFRIADAQGTIYLDLEGEADNDKPEIDRRDLRTLLLDAIPTESVRWNSKVSRVKKIEDGSMAVHFADGRVESGFRLVIGADGHWSKARALITPARPVYHGVTTITCWLRPKNPHHATASSLAGDGIYVALGSDKGVVIARLRDTTYQVGAMLRLPEDWRADQAALLDDPKTLQNELCQHFSGWSESMRDIITNVEGAFHTWPQYSLPPEGLQWEHVPGITLIGDAAHLTVSGGHGVNSAMFDAYQLAQNITTHGIDKLDAAVIAYETEMLPRVRATLKKANASLQHMISPNAPGSWLKELRGESDD